MSMAFRGDRIVLKRCPGGIADDNGDNDGTEVGWGVDDKSIKINVFHFGAFTPPAKLTFSLSAPFHSIDATRRYREKKLLL
jgi:hypothetical protein